MERTFKPVKMVGIVDYGMGNLLSVYNAIEMCGSKMKIIQVPEELPMVDKIILLQPSENNRNLSILFQKHFH